MIKLFSSVIARVNEWVGWLSGLCILFIVGIITREVVGRGVFNSASVSADEAMTYIAGFVYVLGGGYAMLHRRHVTVDIVYAIVSPSTKRIFDLIAFVLFSAYCFTLIWYGGQMAWSSWAQGETSGTLWNPTLWPVKIAIPLGALLLYLQGLSNLIQNFTTQK